MIRRGLILTLLLSACWWLLGPHAVQATLRSAQPDGLPEFSYGYWFHPEPIRITTNADAPGDNGHCTLRIWQAERLLGEVPGLYFNYDLLSHVDPLTIAYRWIDWDIWPDLIFTDRDTGRQYVLHSTTNTFGPQTFPE